MCPIDSRLWWLLIHFTVDLSHFLKPSIDESANVDPFGPEKERLEREETILFTEFRTYNPDVSWATIFAAVAAVRQDALAFQRRVVARAVATGTCFCIIFFPVCGCD